MAEEYDLIIIGGGLVGLAMAVAISGEHIRRPLRTLIIDQDDPAAKALKSQDRRGSAIAESSKMMLQAIGVWPSLQHAAEPMREIIVTDGTPGRAARPVLLSFDESLLQGQPSAHMVENGPLFAAMHQSVSQSQNITVKPKSKIASWQDAGGFAFVKCEDGEEYRSRLIAAADGRHSFMRKSAKIDTIAWSYGQSAIVCSVNFDLPHHGRAEEHFLPAGPFAILPLCGNRASLVWTEEASAANRLAALPEAAFISELTQRFGKHLGEVRLDGAIQVFPLELQIAKRFVSPRLALLGDAAHVIHPIAGLGFNLGLRDIAALSQVIDAAAGLGRDIGDLAVLQDYERWRRADTVAVAAVTDGLNRLFSNSLTGAKVIRDLGLGVVNNLRPVKTGFMRTAAGLRGGQPKLLNGERL